ncbi:hypothetical protein CC86DRAFT_402757 [Ophiobolus disseminans]|uniref:Uncharacterized protein n=1 Tax=Ophiobolus disseminans TaxID=1469910 RepID=A0A6A7ADE2_9PLEO|nr:hypothetical protein CC86DRAFT_402757 [Ophiobolus disseminans]
MAKFGTGGFDASSFSTSSFVFAPIAPEQASVAPPLPSLAPAMEAQREVAAALVQDRAAADVRHTASPTAEVDSPVSEATDKSEADSSGLDSPPSPEPYSAEVGTTPATSEDTETSQEPASSPDSSAVGDNVVVKEDDIPRRTVQDTLRSAQVDLIMQDHSAKYNDIVARIEELKAMIASKQLANVQTQQTELTNIAPELVVKVEDFSNISGQAVMERLANTSCMITGPEKEGQTPTSSGELAETTEVGENAEPQDEPALTPSQIPESVADQATDQVTAALIVLSDLDASNEEIIAQPAIEAQDINSLSTKKTERAKARAREAKLARIAAKYAAKFEERSAPILEFHQRWDEEDLPGPLQESIELLKKSYLELDKTDRGSLKKLPQLCKQYEAFKEVLDAHLKLKNSTGPDFTRMLDKHSDILRYADQRLGAYAKLLHEGMTRQTLKYKSITLGEIQDLLNGVAAKCGVYFNALRQLQGLAFDLCYTGLLAGFVKDDIAQCNNGLEVLRRHYGLPSEKLPFDVDDCDEY